MLVDNNAPGSHKPLSFTGEPNQIAKAKKMLFELVDSLKIKRFGSAPSINNTKYQVNANDFPPLEKKPSPNVANQISYAGAVGGLNSKSSSVSNLAR